MVFLGSDDTVAVTATASDPDNDPLTYTWTSTGGRVDGTGAQVRWLSAGTAVGTYTVTVKVDDGRGGSASCSVDISVQPKPKHPPTITCSANPTFRLRGRALHITCNANSPDGDTLTFTWRANAGRVTGASNSPNSDFDTTGLSPGDYTITTRVDDGQGGAADASVIVTVKPVPPAPQASKIDECAFGKPLSTRIDNVCKRILDDVALRLQNEPRATAVIIGYSDPKERQPAKIAGDRGTNAVKYLGEKGIDASGSPLAPVPVRQARPTTGALTSSSFPKARPTSALWARAHPPGSVRFPLTGDARSPLCFPDACCPEK